MTKDKNCRHLLGSLSEYVDGTLEEELCEELRKHLEDCQDCQIVVDTLKKTVYLYHATSTEPVTLPGDVRERLYHCLDLEDFLDKGGNK